MADMGLRMGAVGEGQQSKFLRWSSYFSYGDIVIRTFLSIYSYFLLANFLSKEEFGLYYLLVTTLFALAALTFAGIEQALTRFGSEYIAHHREADLGILVFCGLFIRSVLLAIALGLGWIMLPQLTEIFNVPVSVLDVLPLFILTMVLARLRTVIGEGFLCALQMQFADKVISTSVAVLRATGFTYLYFNNGKLEDIVLIWLLTEFLAFVVLMVLFWMLYPSSGEQPGQRRDGTAGVKGDLKDISRFGMFSWLSNVAGAFNDLLVDNLFIAYYLSVVALGPYGIASRLVTAVVMLNPLVILRSVLISQIVRRYYQIGEAGDFVQLAFRSVMKTFLFLTVPLYSLFVIYLDPLVTVLFPSYMEAVILAQILVSGLIFRGASYAYTPFIILYKKMSLMFTSNIFSVLNIVLNIVLVQIFGLEGIALATAISTALYLPYFAIGSRIMCPVPLKMPWRGLLGTVINVVPSVVISLAAVSLFHPVAALCVGIPLSLLAYLVMSCLFPVFDEDERDYLAEMFGRYSFKIRGFAVSVP